MSILLRSGDIKNYSPLGQDGQAVYTVATQLRNAIRLRRGKMFADYLAIPQRNDAGNIIDWYVPFESDNSDTSYNIVPWTSATDEEKEKALIELDVFKSNILELGQELAQSNTLKGDQLLFSRLLYSPDSNETEQLKAIRFPNEEHIYLVNDRPVITFWGFTEKNQTIYGDPFFCLRPISSFPKTNIEPILETPISLSPKTSTSSSIPPVINTVSRSGFSYIWLLLPLSLLLAGLLFYFVLRPYFFPDIALNSNAVNTPNLVEETCKESINYYRVNGVLRDINGNIQITSSKCDKIIEDESAYPYKEVDGKWVNRVDGSPIVDSSILANLSTPMNSSPTLPGDNSTSPSLGDSNGITTAPSNPGIGEQGIGEQGTGLANSGNSENSGLQPNENGATIPTGPTKNEENGAETAPNNLVPAPNLESSSNQPKLAQSENTSVNNPANSNNNLTLDPAQLSQGKTDFLNGNWSAGAGIQDKATGKPLKLNYKFNNGKGQVTLHRGDGISCTGNVDANINNGALNLSSINKANCSDGSTYQLPTVACKPTMSGEANCNGAYQGGKSFPMSMKSQN